MPESAPHAAPGTTRQTLRIGPAVASIVTPAGVGGEWIRDHCRSNLTAADDAEAEIELYPLSAGPDTSRRVKTARGEVVVSAASGAVPCVSAGWRLTPRAAARRAKWTLRRGDWRRSRRQLLLRHGLEHPLMSLLDLRHDCFTIHAAAVARDDQVLLLLGTNGAGKTTAALELVEQHGWQLVSDNFVATDGVRAYGFPGTVRPKGADGQEHASGASLSPSSTGGSLAGMLVLGHGDGSERLPAPEAERALRAYIGAEREDHRDSEVFPLIGAVLNQSANSCDTTVVERLARLPVASWDWRRLPVASAVELLSL